MTSLVYACVDFIAIKYRPAAVIFVVLPLSALLRAFEKSKKRMLSIRNVVSTAAERHEVRVKRVSKDIQARPDPSRRICTSRSPFASFSMRFSDYKQRAQQIYVGDFTEIISFDDKCVKVEPLATVGEIAEYLIRHNLMMCTTLEVKDATIGGLSMAVAMTTSSHKYGLLQETVLEYEVILADGRVAKVTRDNEYADLFHAIPWSHGSLAMLVSVTLRVCKTKPYVRVRYEPFTTLKGSSERLRELARHQPREESADFIESTLFSREEGVVMHGVFSENDGKTAIAHGDKWYVPWFYTRVRDVLKRGEPVEELIPTLEYIFRHDRAIFWVLKDMLPEWIGNSWLFRYTLGWMCPPKLFMLKMPAFTPNLREEMRTQRVYQDIVLPLVALEDSVIKSADEFEIWPVLVYPTLVVDHGPGKRGIFPTRAVRSAPKEDRSEFNGGEAALFYDLGVYGIPHQIHKKLPYNGVKSLRKMEHFTTSVGGAPFLYADTFMSPQEFQKTFDLELYQKCRKKYGAEGAFFDLYEKTTSFRKGDDLQ